MRAPAYVWLFAVGATSCSAVLGIEDAEVDPALSPGAGGNPNGGDAGATDAGEPTLCERYCDTVMENCSGDLSVYASRAVCLGTCETLPPGTEGESSGNTISCRLTNAESAARTGEFAFHCPIAGPGGAGVCGENCESFCTTMIQICPNEFPSAADCRTECSTLEDLGEYNSSIQTGNSVQCRLYHVGAATEDPVLHCPHAAGEEQCVP